MRQDSPLFDGAAMDACVSAFRSLIFYLCLLSNTHESSEKTEAVVQGKGQKGQREIGAEEAEIHQ
jgi:hypothetical protein